MSGDVDVRGGVGGIAARLDDLDRAAGLLRSIAAHLGALARRLAGVQVGLAVRPGWTLSAGLSPGTFAATQEALVAALTGGAGLARAGARAEALGVSLDVAVAGYRHAESTLAAGLHGTEITVGRLVGAALLGDPAAGVGLTAGALAVLAGRRFDREWGPGGGSGGLDRDGSGGLESGALRALSAHTGAVQVAAGIAPGLVGTTSTRELASLVAAVAGVAGRWPAPGRSDAGGWLHDSTAVRVRVREVAWAGPAGGIGDLVGRIPPSAGPEPGVHVERIDGADGRRRWLVALPGTADWSPEPGRTPFDLTGDVALMGGEPTASTAGVVRALREVGVRRGEPVLLEGHSQGGIVAARLAADPRVRAEFEISRVITTGSPIAAVPVPSSVAVLSIEHRDDLVPQLDGRHNPAGPTWVTVTTPSPSAAGQGPAGATGSPLAAHQLSHYQQTAALLDGVPDPSLVAWRQGLAGFVVPPGGGGVPPGAGGGSPAPVTGAAWDVEITRAGR